MNTYSIHTKDKMYTIQAAYFTASEMGVMFFNEEAEGIGFVPSYALELVRLEIKIPVEKEYHEARTKPSI